MGERDGGRDLDTALVALIDAALQSAEEAASLSPPERARLVSRALAAGLRELIHAPLREALQAGYELGWRAAHDAWRPAASDAAEPHAPTALGRSAAASVPAASAPIAPEMSLEPAPPLPASDSVPPAGPSTSAEAQHFVHVEVKAVPSFSAVNRFHAAVAGAPGVADATMVAFRDGRLTLRVEHPDGAQLATALQALDVGPVRVLAAGRDRVDLTLETYRPPTIRRHLGRSPASR